MIQNPTSQPAESAQAPAWDQVLLRNPHTVADKRRRVQRMFAAIAPSYDLNNRLHSLWMDQHWRTKAVELASLHPGDAVVDVACGTGDLTLKFADALAKLSPQANGSLRTTGIDFTFAMLPLAAVKARSRGHEAIAWVNGDAQALPLPAGCCDVVSIAFGIRNVADPAAAVREFYRILRAGGRLIVLEFSLPTNPLLRGLYNFYFRKVLPRSATLISRDKTGAYKYLPESVNTFIGPDQMMRMLGEAGFTQVERRPMTCGICVAYKGVK